jgi:hypothetical protein
MVLVLFRLRQGASLPGVGAGWGELGRGGKLIVQGWLQLETPPGNRWASAMKDGGFKPPPEHVILQQESNRRLRRLPMHDVLRARLLRKIESLPEEQVYQILDFIEFLESKYATESSPEASGLQSFAEKLEDQLRKRTVSPSSLREAFQLISAADKVLSNVANVGKELLGDLNGVPEAKGDKGSGGDSKKDDGGDGAGRTKPRGGPEKGSEG